MSENHIVASFDNDMSKLESLFQEMGGYSFGATQRCHPGTPKGRSRSC